MTEPKQIQRAAAIIYRYQGDKLEILLSQEHSGFWTLPGGGQHTDDADVEAALRRELQEELSLTPEMYKYQPTGLRIAFRYDHPTHERFGASAVLVAFLVMLTDFAAPRATAELMNAYWYEYETALAVLKHEDNKNLLRKVKEAFITR